MLGLLSLSGCFQGSRVREDNSITSLSKIKPIDVDASITEHIGREALEKIGYNEIIKLSERAGFVEYKSNLHIQLISYESAVATGFTSVFSRYALAAAVTSQADSPLPGPADLAALGVVVIGLIDAGLLDGYLLNTTGAWLASTSGKPLMSKASTNEARGIGGTTKVSGSANAGGGSAIADESAGTAGTTGAEGGTVPAGRTLSAEEAAVASQLVAEGHTVEALAESSVRTADFLIDGVRTELKSISNITSSDPSGALARRILDGAGQAPNIITDLRRQAGMTEELAQRAVRRAFGVDRAGRVQSVRLIGQGFDVTVSRVASLPPAGL
ncbi:MAG TPA: hypothetical protein PLW65_12110 [Pseudomonadota bacterium]|nr:hypothetical protein [Pseudomonadota bacterium]